MSEWLAVLSEHVIVVINAMALLTIVAGTIEAFVTGVWVLIVSREDYRREQVWARYARWMVAALTFQLAADIVESAIAPSWDDVGKLAAIAVIRTFLEVFLRRDLDEVARRHEVAEA